MVGATRTLAGLRLALAGRLVAFFAVFAGFAATSNTLPNRGNHYTRNRRGRSITEVKPGGERYFGSCIDRLRDVGFTLQSRPISGLALWFKERGR